MGTTAARERARERRIKKKTKEKHNRNQTVIITNKQFRGAVLVVKNSLGFNYSTIYNVETGKLSTYKYIVVIAATAIGNHFLASDFVQIY